MASATPPTAETPTALSLPPPKGQARAGRVLRALRQRTPLLGVGFAVLLLLVGSIFGAHYLTEQAADQHAGALTRHYDALLQDAQNQQTALEQQLRAANRSVSVGQNIISIQKSRIDTCNAFIGENNGAFRVALTSANNGFGYNVNYHTAC